MHISKFIPLANQNPDFENFKDNIFPETMKWEGGSKLHKVSGDSGGWTKFGIAYNYHKDHFQDFQDFTNLTYDQACAFFFIEFYLKTKAQLLPKNCQHYYYDMAVNLGSHRTIRYMQQCIKVSSDGIIGPITESKMQNLSLRCLHDKRVNWYHYLGQRPSQKKFLKGWLNRANYMYMLNQ